jgi:hypothetical protein
MNPTLLTNSFTLPEDGWYQLAPEGEFPHKATGLVQVLDPDACRAIAADFAKASAMSNFGGVLVDYDHFSLDRDKTSEAAGWILNVEHRPGLGLWGKIRWTDTGEAAIRGGRYRYISPVWRQDECDALDGGKVRPRRLTNAAVTNSPNLFGMIPLSNTVRVSPAAAALLANRVLANALQKGNERQRRAFWARLRGSPAAAASREAPTPANTPTPPSEAITVPGRSTLPPKGDNGAYPMPTPNPRPGRPSPGKPGDIFAGGSERFDERLGRYLTDEELAARRAARSRFQEPKTVAQLDADAAREAVEQDRNRELQKIIARRKAIEKSQAAENARAKPWTSAEAGRRAAGVGVAKAAGPRQVGGTDDTAKSKGRSKVIELPPGVTLPLRPRELGLRRTAGALRPQTNQGAIRVRGRSAMTLSDQINADRARIRRTLGNRAPMSDEQRKAMFARMKGGGGAYSAPAEIAFDAEAETRRRAEYAQELADSRQSTGSRILEALDQAVQNLTDWRRWGDLWYDDPENRPVTGTVPGIGPGAPAASVAGIIARARAALKIAAKPGYRVNTPALDVLRKGAEALKAAAVKNLGYVDEATSGALRALRAEEAAIRSGATSAIDLSAPLSQSGRNILRWANTPASEHISATTAAGMSPQKLTALIREIEKYGGQRITLGNRSALTDDQRRAMFAKLRGGGGWSDPPTTGGEAPAAEPDPAAPTAGAPVLDYRSTTRDFDARIELLQKESARLSAAEPRPPEAHDFDTIDTRALRDELLRQGKPLNDVTAAVREAEAHNAAVRQATDAILADLKARGVPASKREAALAAELEKIGKADDKARADYDKAMVRHREKLAAIDRDIEEEEIRKAEAGEKTRLTAGNAAVREAVAADKARATAEAAAAKKAEADAAKAAAATGKTKPVDPVAENRLIKARNRAYAEAIIRGDLDLADRLAPGVDHRANAAAVARLMPSKAELNSPRNQKVMADVIRSLEGTNPHAYPRR